MTAITRLTRPFHATVMVDLGTDGQGTGDRGTGDQVTDDQDTNIRHITLHTDRRIADTGLPQSLWAG